MKRIYNYILLSVLAFAAAGCVEENFNNDMPSAESGDEVQFGLSLSNPETRTIYGMEASNAFPIYWVDGDKVLVYSPECPKGRNQAEYKVTVDGPTQNYASSLTKIGTTGVQWGNNSSATFYSIYPSTNVTWSDSETVTASMNIASTQSLTHTLVNGVYYAADMNNVVMYAKKTANRTDGTVNLKYIPYSTILEFELGVSSTTTGTAFIQSLTLTAPNNIAGKFNLELGENISVSVPSESNSKSVTLQFVTQPELNKTNSTLKAKMCLMPIGAVDMNDWTVTVTYRDGTNTIVKKTKKLYTVEGKSTKLEAGLVHKIKLPLLTTTDAWTYSPTDWMTKLPEYETIYLTELSIPGAWYAGGKGYQDDGHTMESLWNAGVRAFGVECRTTTSGRWNDTPSYVGVSGTGSNNLLTGEVDYYFSADKLSSLISQVASKAKTSGEFAIFVINYAYGAKGGYRETDFKFFLSGVQQAIVDSNADNIAGEITPDTTIEDVKNQVIVKINVDSRVSYDLTSADVMLSTVPLAHTLDGSKVYFSDMKYGSWTGDENSYTESPTITSNSYMWCFTSANRTQLDTGNNSDIPSYQDRKDALQSMIEKSKEIYEGSDHNVWFYFNAGGTETTDLTSDTNASNAQAFANQMNPWLLDVINAKMNGKVDDSGNVVSASDPSPLGLVMFNYCTNTTYSGPTIIKSIIEMNNKFVLKHRPPTSRAASYSSGMNDQGVSAFGWE